MSGLAMRAALLLCIVGAVGGAGSLASAADADATVTVAVSRVDMRKVSPEDARERAVKSSRNDMALVVFGDDATAIQETQDAALDALARGVPVRLVVLASDSQGRGVAVYGPEAAPFGALLPFNSELRAAVNLRVDQLASRLGLSPSTAPNASRGAFAPIDKDDVVRCRREKITGSRLRGERVCSTPREDREREQQAKDSLRRQQDRGSGGNDPRMGGG